MTNEAYISEHREEDVRCLALTKAPDGVDHKWSLQQIEGWQLARKKLPRWAETEGVWYPPRISMEQCSSERTAEYKRNLVERLLPDAKDRCTMMDLTGGLGVDFAAMAPLFREATYVEIQAHLRELARHNMPLLTSLSSNLSILEETRAEGDMVFLDPARRDTAGRKTVLIEDCTPNILEMQDELLARCRYVMVKLSPMLDITKALRQLHDVREVHVVSLQGECKELLFVMSSGNDTRDLSADSADHLAASPGVIVYHCVNLGTDEDEVMVSFEGKSELKGAVIFEGDDMPQYLYEPNASVLKSGTQDVLCERYGVKKLHPMSNLFVGETFIPHFPGRRFRITGWGDFSKKDIRRLTGDLRRANLTIRNFPTSVTTLRRQLRIAEGGDTCLFATTLADGSHTLIRALRT